MPTSRRTVLRPPSQPTRKRERSCVPSASSTVTPSESWVSPTSSQPRRISTPSSSACSVSSRSVVVCGMPRTYGWAVSRCSGDGLAIPAKNPPTGYCLPSARNRSSRPRWSISSMLRACSPSAADHLGRLRRLLQDETLHPLQPQLAGQHQPVGPPPTTITSIISHPRLLPGLCSGRELCGTTGGLPQAPICGITWKQAERSGVRLRPYGRRGRRDRRLRRRPTARAAGPRIGGWPGRWPGRRGAAWRGPPPVPGRAGSASRSPG